MINQIITYLLDKILGKYVDNFSSQNVKTGLFMGDVQLENLPLKPTVLEDLFEWPILVKSGLIERVTLRIPYTRLRTQAWAILIEGIYIIARPNESWKCSEKTFQNENVMKKMLLDSLEAKWRKRVQNQGDNEKYESKVWLSYVASLGYRILRNIQIEVKNLHIRYEDDVTFESNLFSTGLVIDEFSTKSSDFAWDSKGELSTDLDIVNKKIDLRGISIYLDSNCKYVSNDVCSLNIKSILQQRIDNMHESNYIVKPISLHGMMKRNINPLPMHKQPRIYLKLEMKRVDVSLSQAQFKIALAIGEEFDRLDRQKHHSKYRPGVSVMEGPREWWRFAISEHIREVFKGATLRERARNLVKYVQSYEDYLLNKDNANEAAYRNQFELDLEFESLIHLREVAVERASRKSRHLIQSDITTQAAQVSWWDYFRGRRPKSVSTDMIPESSGNSETLQILEKILPEETRSTEQGFQQDLTELLNEVDSEALNFFTRDKIFLRGEFSLDGIKLRLIKNPETPILEMNASSLIIKFESRPLYSSWCTRIGLRSLFIKDLNPSNYDTFSDVVSSVGNVKDDGEAFSLTFETNPLKSAFSTNIQRILVINSEPLNITHCPVLIDNLKEFLFSLRTTKDIKAVAKKHIRNAQARTSESIKRILDKGSSDIRWCVSLKISAPKLIFPNYRQVECHNPSLLLFDFGCLSVSNCHDRQIEYLKNIFDSEHLSEESDLESEDYATPASSLLGSLENIPMEVSYDQSTDLPNDSDIYDNYSITLDNIMTMIGTREELQSSLSKTSQKIKNSIIKPFNLQLNLKRKCMRKSSEEYPNIILSSVLSSLIINISDNKVELVKCCLESLTFLRSEPYKSDISPVKPKKIFRPVETSNQNSNFKSITVDFVLQSFIIQLESQNRPLAELTLTEAQFKLDRYPSNTVINVQLMNLILADARANLGPQLDFILASHKSIVNDRCLSPTSDDPIISFSYVMSSCSERICLKHKMDLIFSELDIIANQETLTELLSFMGLIFSNDSILQKDSHSEPSNIMKCESLEISITCKAVNIMIIKIIRNINSENRIAEAIAKIWLSEMNLLVCKEGPILKSQILVKSVNVEDIRSIDSIHRNILTLVTDTNEMNSDNRDSEHFISISLSQENPHSLFYISGTMPHIIYVHSPQFIHSVKKCISEFQIYFTEFKNNLAIAAQSAILATETGKNTGFFSNSKISFKMLSPILVLPCCKTSNQIILVNLGNIEFYNDTNVLQITLTDTVVIPKDLPIHNQTYDVRLCTDNTSTFPIVKKINLHIRISRAPDSEKIIMECEFSSSLSLSFSKAVYEQFLKTLDNLVYDEYEDESKTLEYDEVLEMEPIIDVPQNDVPILFKTNLYQIEMQLYPDSFENCEDPMLCISLEGISFEFLRANKFIKNLELSLDRIFMYQVLDFKYNRIQKLLISSHNLNDSIRRKSTSCPDIFDESDDYGKFKSYVFLKEPLLYKGSKRKKSFSNSEEKEFSPPKKSKKNTFFSKAHKLDKLAKINIQIIDKHIPGFASEYNSMNRIINAHFNELTFRIRMEGWVTLLDFFGLGSKFYDPKDVKCLSDVSKVPPSFNKRYDGEIEEIKNTQLNAHLNKFSLILENETYYVNHLNLAEIITTDFDLKSISKDGNLTLSGSLSDFKLTDLSPTGNIYNQRLFPSSNHTRIFEFNVFKYGLPDPGLLREEDMKLNVKISVPIVYVHTQRFLQELNQFFQNFLQYQDRLSHVRVTSAGKRVDKSAQRASRIRMQVSCKAPLLLLPVSAFSDHMLIMDLGQFSLHNEFVFNNNDKSQCLLDEMKIDLLEMDVYAAVRIHDTNNLQSSDLRLSDITVRPIFPKPLSKKGNLNLTVCRNLNCNTSHASPDWQISGKLSSVIFCLYVDQYRTIRGVLSHNLGENVDHLKLYKFQAFETDPTLHTDLTGIPWLAMRFELCLNDVQLNLMTPVLDSDSENSNILARFNFYQSKLIYESNSDSTKIIELACQQIIVEDLRYVSSPVNNRLNVFQTIISPDIVSIDDPEWSNNCQLHIKYESNSDENKVIIDLNKMKAIVIFDWLHITKNWIFTPPFEIVSLITNDETRFNKYIFFYVQSKSLSEGKSFQPSDIENHYKKIIQEEFKPTKLILKAQESRFFILEDSSYIHTNALILILAGECSYCTRENRPGPFALNISQFHLASCAMSSDTSGLLSIINPVEITIESEEKLCVVHEKPSLVDALHDKDTTKLGINVAISAFKIRLSFNDIQLLAKIIQSFQNQTVPPANVAFQTGHIRHRWSSFNIDNSNSSRATQSSFNVQKLSKFIDKISINHLGKDKFVSICLIDDCIDADVPLFDIKLYNATVNFEMGTSLGNLKALLSVDYYDTNSFTWTSVIEPWMFVMQWKSSRQMYIESKETLNVDISNYLIQMTRNTFKKWSVEFKNGDKLANDSYKRHHNMFVPFIIVNELGCPMKFRKFSSDSPPIYNEHYGFDSRTQNWIEVVDSNPVPLFFDMETTARDKIKYDSVGTPFHISNRIEIALDGWQKSLPITVDKLGIFYRHLEKENYSGNKQNSPSIRIVISIIRTGSVQNKIIIRSSLQFCNSLNVPIEVKCSEKSSSSILIVDPNTTIPIPLLCVMHNIQIRPCSEASEKAVSPSVKNCLMFSSIDFSDNLCSWSTVDSYLQKSETEVFCSQNTFNFSSAESKNSVCLICTIERLNYPSTRNLPGHLITISSPFTIENRLPCDLRFATKTKNNINNQMVKNEALVRPSGKCTVLTSHMRMSTELSVYLDSFPRCDPLVIHGDVKLNNTVLIRLYDDQNRLLELVVKVDCRKGGPVSVIISAQYWILNRTSLPLLYAQSGGTNVLLAGHVPENEEACSSMPFPFNFSDKNESFTLCFRLGGKYQFSKMKEFKPIWSDGVSLEEEGVTTIQLLMKSLDPHRPHLLFNIGLEIKRGRGIHSSTKMIILTARYLLDNKSSHPLYFMQYNCKDDNNKPIMALPGSFLTFHWPRDDFDQLLTIQKLDSNQQVISQISGGFRIDQCNSFHLYLRGVENNPPSQLRITVSLKGAQYRVVFTDVDDLPSPYKLENLTDLQVMFYQKVSENVSQKHSVLLQQSSILYALDEPMHQPIINLCIVGGTQADYNLNKIGMGQNLYYDNFIYIVINNQMNNENECTLVFDVPSNQRKVLLNTKSSFSRSQLWFYSSDGHLFHEGSIAPHDPKQKLDRSSENHLLLDVDILAPCPSNKKKQMYRMILAKADKSRDKYQKWSFSENGCLTNKIGMNCYINSICKNASVFSGFQMSESYICPLVSKESIRPGSGEVVVSIETDGPTRVLRLEDKLKFQNKLQNTDIEYSDTSAIEVTIQIREFGIFIINHVPEELLYVFCENVHLNWNRKNNKDNIFFKIGKLQVDNQRKHTEFPCVIYEEVKERSSVSDHINKERPRSRSTGSVTDDLEGSNEFPHLIYKGAKSGVCKTSVGAFSLHLEREFGHAYDIHVFTFIKVKFVPLCVVLEEKMLLKTMQMIQSLSTESEVIEEYLSNFQTKSQCDEGKKVYIGKLTLQTGTISLSVITADSLPPDLKKMKKFLPFLTSFTNAQIDIDYYDRNNVFETSELIFQNIAIHYRKQLKNQAIKIFGTVDFLGNPIGFISDITTGMKKFYEDQDVVNMVRYFAHGIGDSTARICNSFSKLVSEITMDPEYEENRQKLLESGRVSKSKTAQVKVGFQSLAYGLYGGIKSVPKQIGIGYKTEGTPGLFIGAFKGFVGVLAKPAGGMLDFATGSAATFREIAWSSKHYRPSRRYEPRLRSASSKLLPRNNKLQLDSLSDFLNIQDNLAKNTQGYSFIESFIGSITIQTSGNSQLKVIVSDESIYTVKTVDSSSNLIKHYPFEKLNTPPIMFCVNNDGKEYSAECYISFNCATDSSKYKCDQKSKGIHLVKLVCEVYSDYIERQLILKD